MASISHRYSIRWPPAPASEPTSTLVLTTPSGYYIDIRIYLARNDGETRHNLPVKDDALVPTTTTSTTPPTSTTTTATVTLPRQRIEWAFAGPSTSIPGTPRSCTWHHWVDNRARVRTIDEHPVSDSGLMWPREEDGMTLEKGAMVNPATGEMGDYEEVWEDLEGGDLVVPEEGGCEWFVFVHDGRGEDGGEGRFSRGVCVQVGVWFQSMLVREEWDGEELVEDEIAVQRWKWSSVDRQWFLICRSGESKLLPAPHDLEAAIATSKANSADAFEHFSPLHWRCTEYASNRTHE